MQVKVCDILLSGADIIVFSAHPTLISGSGVSGVVHRAAGPELEKVAKALGPISPGKAVMTPAFNLPVKYIIHAVCPRYIHGTQDEERLLGSAYASALSIAENATNIESIAFVFMGIGVYRWPKELAAKIAVQELRKSSIDTTILCVHDKSVSLDIFN
jgi:O-acetyl-ADP-ribose deacetylase (regulator of RNase III)